MLLDTIERNMEVVKPSKEEVLYCSSIDFFVVAFRAQMNSNRLGAFKVEIGMRIRALDTRVCPLDKSKLELTVWESEVRPLTPEQLKIASAMNLNPGSSGNGCSFRIFNQS